MKLGEVLRIERERAGVGQGAAAERLGMTVEAYASLEAGENDGFEAAAGLVLRFNELIGGQVNQLYYPCGLPFTEVRGYSVET